MQDQVSDVLRAVTDHSSKGRYTILKGRLRKHLAWAREHHEQLQRMINLLSTHNDYEKELVRLLEQPETPTPTLDPTQRPMNLATIAGSATGQFLRVGPTQSTPNYAHRPESRYKNLGLPPVDDATFLTGLCLLRGENPAYEQIAEEIVREATESLGAKLKSVSKDIVSRAERESERLLQAVSSSFAEERRGAVNTAKLVLLDLIRRNLDEEPEHPTNSYVYDSSHVPALP